LPLSESRQQFYRIPITIQEGLGIQHLGVPVRDKAGQDMKLLPPRVKNIMKLG